MACKETFSSAGEKPMQTILVISPAIQNYGVEWVKPWNESWRPPGEKGHCISDKGGVGKESTVLNPTAKQLQKKFKHAGDFGVTGNFSKANAAKFNSAINQHINSPGVRAVQGTYRGNPVTHYVNPNTAVKLAIT